MPKILVSGRGGSGKSTLTTMLARFLAGKGSVLVIDIDESNLGLARMLGLEPPAQTLIESLGGRKVVGQKLMASIRSKGTEEVRMFTEAPTLDKLPPESVTRAGPLGMVRIGKIEHSKEGCACPMGALARELINKLRTNETEWVIVDTEAGIEHFGRGVLEGIDAILMVVDPSHEAVILAEKAAGLAAEAGKNFAIVLNKTSTKTESRLKEMLQKSKIDIAGILPYSPEITEANLTGEPLVVAPFQNNLIEILSRI